METANRRYFMTRRLFLKLGTLLPSISASFKRKKTFEITIQPFGGSQAGYGTGAYGNGDYPGNSITYLPLIHKEKQ